MNSYRKLLGQKGEELAAGFLIDNKHIILERNFRTKFGEIDIITRKNKLIHFVEVKTYSKGDIRPEDGITAIKQKHLKNTASLYISKYPAEGIDYTFDLIALVKTADNYQIEYFENIFLY